MTEYVIRFEDGKRISSIALDSPSPQDKFNKETAAQVWSTAKAGRTYKISTDSRPNLKLDTQGNIVEVEIEVILPILSNTFKAQLFLALKDDDIKKALKQIKGNGT